MYKCKCGNQLAGHEENDCCTLSIETIIKTCTDGITVGEIALRASLRESFTAYDYALPQMFHDDISKWVKRPLFIWAYDDENSHGRPFPLDVASCLALTHYNAAYGAYYDVPTVDYLQETVKVKLAKQIQYLMKRKGL